MTDEIFSRLHPCHFSWHLIHHPQYRPQYHQNDRHHDEGDEGEGVRETNPADRA